MGATEGPVEIPEGLQIDLELLKDHERAVVLASGCSSSNWLPREKKNLPAWRT
jgi:hypothetical protein